MPVLNLEQILQNVGGYVDQETDTPTGTDLSTRTNYINRALSEWASSYDWNQLTQKYEFSVSGVSCTSFGLPTNFRKPMSAAYYFDATVPTRFTLTPLNERFDVGRYYYSTENIAYIAGNPATGYSLNIPKGLPSGASLVMDIQIYPSSLATFSDTPSIDDPEYLVDRCIAYVLEARSDSKFPIMKASADRKLSTMLERQNAGNFGSSNSIPRDGSFVIGLD